MLHAKWYSVAALGFSAVQQARKSNQWIREAALKAGIPYTTVLHRIDAGKTLDEATQSDSNAKRSIEIAGTTYESLEAAAAAYGVSAKRIGWRTSHGWTAEEAVGIARRARKSEKRQRGKPLTVQGKIYQSAAAAAEAHGFSPALLRNRLGKGLSPEQALEIDPFPSWFTSGKGQFARQRADARRRQESLSGLRTCSTCKKQKPFAEFNKANGNMLSYRCKGCTALALIRCRYGISDDDFHALRKAQSGRCAICSCDLELSSKTVSRRQTVAVDHCHKTGAVRGLLCNCCNSGLGSLGDDPERLANAIKYLAQAKNGSPVLAARRGRVET